jgi:hypothetical protein
LFDSLTNGKCRSYQTLLFSIPITFLTPTCFSRHERTDTSTPNEGTDNETVDIVDEEIVEDGVDVVSLPILENAASDLLTVGNSIPTTYAQEGAATDAVGQDLTAERVFTDPTGDDEDIDVDEIFDACRSLSINLYKHFGTNGSIGSLHTGKVMLVMKEEELEGEPGRFIRKISPARMDMMIAGGQCYMPTFLHQLLGKQRKNHKHLAAFPMMLTRALLRHTACFDYDRKKLLAELSKRWVPIMAMAKQAEWSIDVSFPSVLRFEFFFGTTLEHEFCDFKFPDIPYEEIAKGMHHPEFIERWKNDLSENRKPLESLMRDVRSSLHADSTEIKLELLSSSVKTRLVLHSEQLLMNLQVKTFFGAISKSIFECMHVAPSRQLFFIPEGLKRHFEEDGDSPYGLDFGLDPSLLALPLHTSLLDDMERKLRCAPRHIQQLQGQMRHIVQSPNGYYHYTGKALRKLLCCSYPEEVEADPNIDFGLFENPEYNVIASMSLEAKVELLDFLAICVWDMYDAEWWLMTTEYAKVSVDHMSFATSGPYSKTLSSFPRTVDTFEKWDSAYGSRSSLLHLSRAFNHNQAEIKTVGK